MDLSKDPIFGDHHLLTLEQIDQLRENGFADFTADRIPVVRIFDPSGSAQWLISAMKIRPDDSARPLFYGLADFGLGSPEIGVIDLDEAETSAKKLGCPLQRDKGFDADGKTIQAFLADLRARR